MVSSYYRTVYFLVGTGLVFRTPEFDRNHVPLEIFLRRKTVVGAEAVKVAVEITVEYVLAGVCVSLILSIRLYTYGTDETPSFFFLRFFTPSALCVDR